MQTNPLKKFAQLVQAGLLAAGSSVPISLDAEAVVVRDIFVEFDTGRYLCFRTGDPDTPFASFAEDAVVSAAQSICCAVLSSIAVDAIERAARQAA